MTRSLSAGLLLYRTAPIDGVTEVLLVHPGGPFWARKDAGSWSVPKGEYEEPEDPRAAAGREFGEEIGLPVPDGQIEELGVVKQPSGKVITVFVLESDLEISAFKSNTFEMEWPRGSDKLQEFPEVDKAEWMSIARARIKLLKGQTPFLDLLVARLADRGVAVDEGDSDADGDQGALF